MSGQEKWSQAPGQSFRFIDWQTKRVIGFGAVLYKNLRLNFIIYMPLISLRYHTLPSSNKLISPCSFSLSQSISALPHLVWHTHTHTSANTHKHTHAHYSVNLRASRCRMASECEKGTSSCVYRALLSTHPFPQWPHWGWAQVKAYLKGLFNTEKRGRIPEPQGRGDGGRERDSQQAPHPPPQLFLQSRAHVALTIHFIFFSRCTSAFCSFSCALSEICFSRRVCAHVDAPQFELNRGQGPTERERTETRVGVVVKVDSFGRGKQDGWAEGRKESKGQRGNIFPSTLPPSRLSLLLMWRTSLAGLRSGPVIVYGALRCLTQEPH